jgi:hypothetical protein
MMARPRAYLEQILQSLDRIASYAAEGSRAFFESPLSREADGIAFPGDGLTRFSFDVATGSAGIMLALAGIIGMTSNPLFPNMRE